MMSEEQQQQFEQVPQSQLEIKERARAIHLALSNRDSFEIFCLAAYGIIASTSSWREQGFSKKRYYLRLKGLSDLGLVHKDGGKYKHSALGRIVYESQVKSLESTLKELAKDQNSHGDEFQ